MTVRVYDTDNGTDYAELLKLNPMGTFPAVYPRRTVYGTPQAVALGLDPVEATPNVLLEPDQYVDAIAEAHEMQTLPMYHARDTWRPKGFQWNQDGIGYCWTWSGTGALMTCRAMESKDTVMLAPVSMGYLVGWADRGNYLESFINGAREDGVCPAVDGEYNSHNRSRSYWDQHDEDRSKYKLGKVWDTRSGAMTQHCLSILKYGRPLYSAWNHMGHAMEVLAVRYVNGSLEWIISNSWNKRELFIMKGSKAVPDEAYGFVSTKLA